MMQPQPQPNDTGPQQPQAPLPGAPGELQKQAGLPMNFPPRIFMQ
jgi:hypothetical protein